MIHLSIPVRQALAKLTLPVLIVAAFGLMLVGKADTLLAERARMALADALAPIMAVIAQPASPRPFNGRERRADADDLRRQRAAARGERAAAAVAVGGRWRWMPRTPR